MPSTRISPDAQVYQDQNQTFAERKNSSEKPNLKIKAKAPANNNFNKHNSNPTCVGDFSGNDEDHKRRHSVQYLNEKYLKRINHGKDLI